MLSISLRGGVLFPCPCVWQSTESKGLRGYEDELKGSRNRGEREKQQKRGAQLRTWLAVYIMCDHSPTSSRNTMLSVALFGSVLSPCPCLSVVSWDINRGRNDKYRGWAGGEGYRKDLRFYSGGITTVNGGPSSSLFPLRPALSLVMTTLLLHVPVCASQTSIHCLL